MLCWAPDFDDRTRSFELASIEAAAPFDINYECNAALTAWAKTCIEEDLLRRCRQLDVPTLMLHGAGDPRPSWAVDSLASALPSSDLRLLPTAGHLPWTEASLETAITITAFLDSLAPRSPHAAILRL